jgi:RNA polymerase sigma-70 factor (ECF subfamily)
MARNLAIDRVRTATAARARDHLVLATLGGIAAGPEELVLERFARQGLLCAIRLRSIEHRAVLVLSYFAELLQSEIAAALEIPVGTVKSRLTAALRQLRKVIEAG